MKVSSFLASYKDVHHTPIFHVQCGQNYAYDELKSPFIQCIRKQCISKQCYYKSDIIILWHAENPFIHRVITTQCSYKSNG